MSSGFLTADEIENFKKITESYIPPKELIDKFFNSSFAVIAGPAVSGKDTLREGLIAAYPDFYCKVLSLTTRNPRAEETNAYKFVSPEQMLRLAEQKQLLQLALVHNQQVSATNLSEIENIAEGKIGLSILIVQAEQKLYALKPNMKTIFMIPPSYEELLQRMRRERVSNEDEIKRRLNSAKHEINIALKTKRYYLLVSDVEENARKRADEFLRLNKRNPKEVKRAEKTCREILKKLG